MSTKEPNKLFDTNDSISFGQMKDEPFKWIYLLSTPYLVWIIENTDICFSNLELFYQFGKPLRLNVQKITELKMKQISTLIQNIGKNNYAKGGKSYILTVEIFSKIIEQKIVDIEMFYNIDFEFSEITIEKNNEKLNSSLYNFHKCNFERNNYLSKIFCKRVPG